MNKNDNVEYSKRFYRNLYLFMGNSPQSVGWINGKNQSEQFNVVLENVTERNPEILDVGCGLCHLYFYLKDYMSNLNYLGIDVIDKFVNIGKQKNINVRLQNLWDLKENYDNIVCLGTFGFSDHGREGIRFLFDRCNKKLIISFLKTANSKKLVLYPQKYMMKYAKSFCKNVKVYDFKMDYVLVLSK